MQPRTATLDDILRAPAEACSALLVVLAGVQDPGNVGTIMRTASAFGATGAVTTASGQSGTASPFSPKALRASAGAALHLPILAGMSLPILLTQLRVADVRTLASSVHEPRDGDSPLLAPWEVNWCEPVALARRQRRRRLAGRSGTQRGRAHPHSDGERHRIAERGRRGGGACSTKRRASESLFLDANERTP